MNEWQKLIRQKASKGGEMSREERRELREVRAEEAARRFIAMRNARLPNALRELGRAVLAAITGKTQ